MPEQRYRQAFSWEPHGQFQLAFANGAAVLCGGIEDPGSWEGPNVNWVWIDEARNIPTPDAFKVLNGRIRIAGPMGTPPQMWMTTTTKMNWLYEYFGPLSVNALGEVDDPFADLKMNCKDVTLMTADNMDNLEDGYANNRSLGLSDAERQVLLEGAWVNIGDERRFLDSMLWWDACQEVLPMLDPREPMVVALDAGVSHDTFGMVAVTRHPHPNRRRTDVAVRFAQAWTPPPGGKLDFGSPDGPEQTLRELCKRYNVIRVRYDPYQLHDMATRLSREKVAVAVEFAQGSERLEADTALRDIILRRGIAHDGNRELYHHLDNADAQLDGSGRKMRIVKRASALKVDLAVALSMAVYDILSSPLSASWGAIIA